MNKSYTYLYAIILLTCSLPLSAGFFKKLAQSLVTTLPIIRINITPKKHSAVTQIAKEYNRAMNRRLALKKALDQLARGETPFITFSALEVTKLNDNSYLLRSDILGDEIYIPSTNETN